MSKISYGMKTCLKYQDRTQACIDTWCQGQDVVLSTDLTTQDVADGYDGLTRKTHRFFGTHTFTPGNWFLYADDDTFVNTKALEKFVETLDSSQIVVLGRGCMPCPAKTKRSGSPSIDNLKQPIPKHIIFQGGAGTLLSYPACLMIQLMIWSGKAPEHQLYLAEDQWLTACIGSYAHLMSTYLGSKKTIRWGGKAKKVTRVDDNGEPILNRKGKEVQDGEEEMFQTIFNEKSIERVVKGEAVTLHHVLPDDMHSIYQRMLDEQKLSNENK